VGKISINIPFDVGDLVFAAEKTEHQYSCECLLCSGFGFVTRPEGQAVVNTPRNYYADDLEDDEDFGLADDEEECPYCGGEGEDDIEIAVLFPTMVGRIFRVIADTIADLDEEDIESEEEVTLSVRPLVSAGIDADSELGRTEQMLAFYYDLKANRISDFMTVDSRDKLDVDINNVGKTFKQLCENVLRRNLTTFKMIQNDLTNPDHNIKDFDKMELITACGEIVQIQDMILSIYPEFGKIVPGYKPSKYQTTNEDRRGNTITEKVEKPQANDALMALASVEVEEALL